MVTKGVGRRRVREPVEQIIQVQVDRDQAIVQSLLGDPVQKLRLPGSERSPDSNLIAGSAFAILDEGSLYVLPERSMLLGEVLPDSRLENRPDDAHQYLSRVKPEDAKRTNCEEKPTPPRCRA